MQIQRDTFAMTAEGAKGTSNPLPQTEQMSPGIKPAQDEVVHSVDSLQKQLDLMKETQVQMEYDKEIDRVIVKYVSQESGEIVSQIPTEKFVEFQKEFVRTIGILFDLKV